MPSRASSPRDRYFRFLSRLNAGGRSNMYGAIPYLAAAFGLDRETAFRIVCEWLDARVQPSAAAPPGGRLNGGDKAGVIRSEPHGFRSLSARRL